MIAVKELREWLKDAPDSHGLAVEECGLILILIDERGEPTGHYLEVGGEPDGEQLPEGIADDGSIAVERH